jgi:AcrR family transcriptional regulator
MSEVQRRRSRILEAADRLLCHYGPSKTTIADVAREAGVGVGTVYLEFPSKDAIVEALSRARHADVIEAMRAAATSSEKTASEQLAAALDARLEAFLRIADGGAHACDLVHCVTPSVKAAQAAFQAEEVALLADVLRRGTLAGELDAPDADGVARTVLRAYVTFTLPWLREREPREARASIASMHLLVLRGLVRRPGRAAR